MFVYYTYVLLSCLIAISLLDWVGYGSMFSIIGAAT